MEYVHVGINVTNLEASIKFYQKVFGIQPVKTKIDYAKFLLDEPGLNFTLNVRDDVKGNQVNHFGFQVETPEEIHSHKSRLEKEGFFAREEIDTTCCYAVQDKFWVTDPDRNEWEFFYTKSDSEVHQTEDSVEVNKKSSATNSCC